MITGVAAYALNALATITARTNGNNVELRGEISTTDDHEVKFVRRVIKI